MKAPSPSQRFCAFTFDFILYVSFFFGVGRILWWLVPNTEVPIAEMTLFSPKEATVYLWTVLIGVVVALCYFVVGPVHGGTLGQRLFQIRLARADGSALRYRNLPRLSLVPMVKTMCIFLLGPLAAFNGGSSYLALVLLFFPFGLILACILSAWLQPDGRGLFERLGGYRLVSMKEQ